MKYLIWVCQFMWLFTLTGCEESVSNSFEKNFISRMAAFGQEVEISSWEEKNGELTISLIQKGKYYLSENVNRIFFQYALASAYENKGPIEVFINYSFHDLSGFSQTHLDYDDINTELLKENNQVVEALTMIGELMDNHDMAGYDLTINLLGEMYPDFQYRGDFIELVIRLFKYGCSDAYAYEHILWIHTGMEVMVLDNGNTDYSIDIGYRLLDRCPELNEKLRKKDG